MKKSAETESNLNCVLTNPQTTIKLITAHRRAYIMMIEPDKMSGAARYFVRLF